MLIAGGEQTVPISEDLAEHLVARVVDKCLARCGGSGSRAA
jgi:hypothetical protein